jgi:hypothetical protein
VEVDRGQDLHDARVDFDLGELLEDRRAELVVVGLGVRLGRRALSALALARLLAEAVPFSPAVPVPVSGVDVLAAAWVWRWCRRSARRLLTYSARKSHASWSATSWPTTIVSKPRGEEYAALRRCACSSRSGPKCSSSG